MQLSLACFRVARSPSNSWASCIHSRRQLLSWPTVVNVFYAWYNYHLSRRIVYCFRSIYLFISLFLCQQDYEKMAGLICMKFSGKVWGDHGTIWLDFWSIPRNRAMPQCATQGRGLLCFSTTATACYNVSFFFYGRPISEVAQSSVDRRQTSLFYSDPNLYNSVRNLQVIDNTLHGIFVLTYYCKWIFN